MVDRNRPRTAKTGSAACSFVGMGRAFRLWRLATALPPLFAYPIRTGTLDHWVVPDIGTVAWAWVPPKQIWPNRLASIKDNPVQGLATRNPILLFSFVGLLSLRPMTNREEVNSYISNAQEATSLQALALVIGTRWRVEELFEDAKGQLGMADYETRAWTSWHHHMSLVALAHLYVTPTKNEVAQEIPELTLDMAVRMLRSTFARQTVTEDDAINIIEYHMRRNRVAHDSHRKSWLKKHQRDRPKTLL